MGWIRSASGRRRCAIGAIVGLGLGCAVIVCRVICGAASATTEPLLVTVSSKHPSPNLLRNSTFIHQTNAGVPDFWGTNAPELIKDWRGCLEIVSESPVAGAQSVRLKNPQEDVPLTLQSHAARLAWDFEYTFSVYLRSAQSEFPVFIDIGAGKDVRGEFIVGKKWKRYSVTGATKKGHWARGRIIVRVSLPEQGTVWIATPQLEIGTMATEYQPSSADKVQVPVKETPLNATVELSYYTDERRARVLVNSNLREAAEVRVYAWPQDGGRALQLRPKVHAVVKPKERRWISYEIDRVPVGRYELGIFALDKNGRRLARVTDVLTKLPPARHEVQINRVGRHLVVNGEPIIVYGQGIHEDAKDWWLADIADHGFNTVVAMLPTLETPMRQRMHEKRVRRFLDEAKRRRLHVIVWLRPGNKSGSFPEWRQKIVATIERLKDHESILIWYLLDEPESWWAQTKGQKQEGQLVDLLEAAKKADPYRPSQINWFRWTAGRGGYGSLAATDIGSLDNYPIGKTEEPMERIAELVAQMNRDCRSLRQPVAFWVQQYGYDDAVREPTPDEERAMTYLNLIHGSRLTYYFIYKPMSNELWESMKPLGKEMREIERLLTDPDAYEVEVGIQDKVNYAMWMIRGRLYLIACNAGSDVEVASLHVANSRHGDVVRARRMFDRRPVRLKNGELKLRLLPYERAVVELR